jgi:hypothetical protein
LPGEFDPEPRRRAGDQGDGAGQSQIPSPSAML